MGNDQMRGFGMTLGAWRGVHRHWYLGADGVKRWVDNDEALPDPCVTHVASRDALPLHQRTGELVDRFSAAMAQKMAMAEQKYGYTDNWRNSEWMDECRAKLSEHIAKGDPLDVAAYCAFLWHHGEATAVRSDPACRAPASAIDAMAQRFVFWPLPANFSPDGGITYTRPDPALNPHLTGPVGTNLLSVDQARAMFEYCLAGAVFGPPVAWQYRHRMGVHGHWSGWMQCVDEAGAQQHVKWQSDAGVEAEYRSLCEWPPTAPGQKGVR